MDQAISWGLYLEPPVLIRFSYLLKLMVKGGCQSILKNITFHTRHS